jgi:hypothetical protein
MLGTRDHAIIRLFTAGVCRAELVQIRMAGLPLDLIAIRTYGLCR